MESKQITKPVNWSNKELVKWIRSQGETFQEIADVFVKNGVEGEDLFDESIFSKPSYDEMLDSVSTIFAKNKLWKKIQALKNKSRPAEPFKLAMRVPEKPFNQWERPPTMSPLAPSSKENKQFYMIPRKNSVFAQNSLSDSPNKPVYLLEQKLRGVPRRPSYAQNLRDTTPPPPSVGLNAASSPPKRKPSLRENRTKMMLWRGVDPEAKFEPEILESFLESGFNVTFRYQYTTNRFSLYGTEDSVRKALSTMDEQNLVYEKLFDHLYDVDSLELHISPRDRRNLSQNEELTNFLKENDVKMFSEATSMTKPNGEKKIRLLITGPKMPEVANLVAQILFRDFSKVYTNYIFTTQVEAFDSIMTNPIAPYWREVAQETDTTVRVLNKKGVTRRHVLISGKVSQVLKAKEMLEQRLNSE